MVKSLRSFFSSGSGCALLAFMLTVVGGSNANAATTVLADSPVYSASNVPANLMLALSVEFPTGLVAAYKGTNDYASGTKYLGYFDNGKCYDYDSGNGWFTPVNKNGPSCAGHWSGNMLNWATMAALDEFRQALTGGNRGVDTSTNTVLLRSNLTTQGSYSTNFPDKSVTRSTTVGDSTFSSSTVWLRSGGLGTTFQVADNSSFSNSSGNKTKTYNAKVQVCVANLLESNCNSAHDSGDYVGAGVYNKPEGLIQQNFTKIRVGASAYAFLNGNGSGQANGVVRALLRDNGPTQYNGNGARTANVYKEWDSTTGIFITNPDTADTTKTAPGGGNATQTGAINYLNQFGYTSAGYETYDTISDLYWATLAYLMQVPLDKSYTKNLTATNSLDPKFPVFAGTPPNDPISYSCQANAIVTIGDDHTHYDTGVPGGTLTSVQVGGGLPVIAANGTVPAVDAAKYTTALGNLPLIEGTTPATKSYSQYWSGSTPPALGTPLGGLVWGDQGTYYMPGLAYFAHTNDIRNDDPNKVATLGKQTVDTYAVDVLEPGSYDASKTSTAIYNPTTLSTAGPNIYWLAAKYGGFNDVNGDGKPANFLTWHTNSTTAAANTLRPDNFFQGNQPDLLQAGLSQIFNRVASTSAARGAAPSVTSTRALTTIGTGSSSPYNSPVGGFPIYNVQYKPVSWVGDVNGFIGTATAGGDVTAVTGGNTWSAQTQLESLTQVATSGTIVGWNTGRRILTMKDDTNAGVPFRYTSLSTAEQTAIGSANLLNYLRGDRSNEAGSGASSFRARSYILGDIVNSQAVLVQSALSPAYSESTNPGYTNFLTSVASRAPVVYVGANDGMLHAFAADFNLPPTSGNTVTGGGSELFAYVPSLLYKGPNATPQVDGLAALANLTGVSTNPYNHHFYVDSTPQVADVDFSYTGLNPTVSTAISANWQSILVGGLGKGGKGIYALNITTVPTAVAKTGSDSTTAAGGETKLAASKVMWEFTDADMGYSYGRPLIVKTRNYGWVVVMTSGYNNTSGPLAGHGILYVLNAKTGALLQKIDTGVGTAASPSGLAQATGYTQDVSDGTIDQIYAGDLLGNVWRFDLTALVADGSGNLTYPLPTKFATLTDPSGVVQPITTAPRIELSLDSTGLGTLRWVFVGTGKFLDTSDLNNTQQQSMYALRDGTGSIPLTTGLPLGRSVLTANPLVTPLNLGDSATGWYYDLPGTAGTNGGTERVVVNPDAAAGVSVIAWATMTPSTDPCSLQGNIYAADFSTGQSVLQDDAGNFMKSITTNTATTGLQMIQLPDGTYSILYGQTGSLPKTAKIKQPGNNNYLNRVNWREILK